MSEHSSPTFAAAIAAASGMNRRTVEKAAARGEDIPPEKLQKIVGTSLDKACELDALAKMPMPQRDQLIEAAASGEMVTARDSLKGKTHSSPAHAEGDARTGMAALPETPEASAEVPKAFCAKGEAAPSGLRSDTVTDNATAHTASEVTSTAAAPSDPVSETWFGPTQSGPRRPERALSRPSFGMNSPVAQLLCWNWSGEHARQGSSVRLNASLRRKRFERQRLLSVLSRFGRASVAAVSGLGN